MSLLKTGSGSPPKGTALRQVRMISHAPPETEPKITAMKTVAAISAMVTMRRIACASTSSMNDSSGPTGASRRASQMFAPITTTLSTAPAKKSETFQIRIVRKTLR